MRPKKYVNAKDVLPEHLIEEIQKFVQGQHVYIPQVNRKPWGTVSGMRIELDERNRAIILCYQGGLTIAQLSEQFALSEERIRAIVYENQTK
ncbi:CD3324 family protein [Paenibacillus ginsengarvi]|uniref:Mor transcription activator domain-containing protein n=1 Tax=Paenibacillus ginsengarvi TaxID=400777 RepID=A0A3B0C5L7_9BACL|nr:CD3324 family protein [Paenibacillus ginsengarvi]RKN79249.1 hypothetical protein D7M11_21465 [Paenibacillus ginsengarvi]